MQEKQVKKVERGKDGNVAEDKSYPGKDPNPENLVPREQFKIEAQFD